MLNYILEANAKLSGGANELSTSATPTLQPSAVDFCYAWFNLIGQTCLKQKEAGH